MVNDCLLLRTCKKQKKELKYKETNSFLPDEMLAHNSSTARTLYVKNISSKDLSLFKHHKVHGLHRELSLLERLLSRKTYYCRLDYSSLNVGGNIYHNTHYGARCLGNYQYIPSTRQLGIL